MEKTVDLHPVRSKDQFLVFGAPLIEEAEIQEVLATMRSGWLGTGPKVAQFEKEFAAYKNASHALAVNSCTAALHLAAVVAGLKPEDEVITTPLTFCASANAMIHAGAKPVLADVDPCTMNIDPVQIETKITPKTRAILPVHFAGRPCEMDPIMEIARRHNLLVIEDCAHAIETEYHGQPAGTFGDFGCFSFYVTKNVATGEGGMILSNREEHLARLRMLSLHGMSRDAWKRFSSSGYQHYQVMECGYKYNMMDLQAAIGLHQLSRVEACWQRRAEIWQRYNEAFSGLPVLTPAPSAQGTRHAYHLYTLLIDEAEAGISRDNFIVAMTAQNIGVGVHYLSLPEHPYYQETFGWRPKDYPNAMRIGRQTVSLPISPKLTDADVEDVVNAVYTVLGKKR